MSGTPGPDDCDEPFAAAANRLARTTGAWDAMRQRRITLEDAETCRIAMADAATVGDFAAISRWRARALARFATLNWQPGVAAVLVSEALRELAIENADYAAGRTIDQIRGSETALEILDEARHLVRGAEDTIESAIGPTRKFVVRLLHEKSGFLLCVLGRLGESRARYEEALVAAHGDERGTIKVQAALALVDYLDGRPADQTAATTDALATMATGPRQRDIAEAARMNSAVMREGGRELVPYEIL